MQGNQSTLKKQCAGAASENVEAGHLILSRIRLKLHVIAFPDQARRKRQGFKPHQPFLAVES